jgi:hypothetical protein
MAGCGSQAPDASVQSEAPNEGASNGALGESGMSLEEQAERQRFAEAVVGPDMAEKALRNTAEQGSVFTLELADGRVFEWLEPNYGKLMLSETGAEEAFVSELRKNGSTTASAAFTAVQPGVDVPDVLRAFDARIAEMAPVYQALRDARRDQDPTAWDGAALQASDSQFAQNEQALTKEVRSGSATESEFETLCNGLYPHVTFGSPGNKIKFQDINGGVGVGFGKKGKITMQVKVRQWWDWEQVFRQDVSQGKWRSVYMYDDIVDFDMETAVYADAGEKARSCQARP